MRLRRDLLLFGLLAVAALAGGWWLLQQPGADRPGLDGGALGKAAPVSADTFRATVCGGRRWSYGALLAAARGAALEIQASGASHVALLDESSEAAAIALFGAALAGVPYVPLNYRLADQDLGKVGTRKGRRELCRPVAAGDAVPVCWRI